MNIGIAEIRVLHTPVHYITSILQAGYLLSLSLPPQGFKEISKSPTSELGIPSTIHSLTAGKLGINQRGNVVNSREFFLSVAQLVAGHIAT